MRQPHSSAITFKSSAQRPTSVDALSLTCVEFLARVERFFFGVIEDEMTGGKGLGVACGIKRRTVVLLIRFEALAVGIETESLTHQPISIQSIGAARLIVGLITQADNLLTIGKKSFEAKLLFLGGIDVETLQLHITHLKTVAVLKLVEDDALGYSLGLLLGQQRLTEKIEQADDALMAVDMEQPRPLNAAASCV